MVAVGLIEEGERLELLGGELVPMSPKGYFHDRLKIALNMYLARLCPERFVIAQETTFRLSDDTFVEPDFLIFPASVSLRDLTGTDAVLAV